jgi:hypothetical protein
LLSLAVNFDPTHLLRIRVRHAYLHCLRVRVAHVVQDSEDKMSDRDLTNSWLQRARADGTLDASLGAESNMAGHVFAATSRDGWDPWEVWLRHIDQPRRQLIGRRLKLPA